jgi:hypothetical protein
MPPFDAVPRVAPDAGASFPSGVPRRGVTGSPSQAGAAPPRPTFLSANSGAALICAAGRFFPGGWVGRRAGFKAGADFWGHACRAAAGAAAREISSGNFPVKPNRLTGQCRAMGGFSSPKPKTRIPKSASLRAGRQAVKPGAVHKGDGDQPFVTHVLQILMGLGFIHPQGLRDVV